LFDLLTIEILVSVGRKSLSILKFIVIIVVQIKELT